MTEWPTRLQVNAFAGDSVGNASDVDDTLFRWAARPQDKKAASFLKPEEVADESDWMHPRVGWGLVLPDNPKLKSKQLARADDAPEPLRRLMEARPEAPVLRFRRETWTTHLRRHYPAGGSQDLALVGSERGVGKGQLPLYLLLCGTPDEIPWRFQYLLNQTSAVGRLALDDDALDRYVTHLIDDWSSTGSDVRAAVVWTADHGGDDISHLMRTVIAEPVFEKYAGDGDLRAASLLVASQGDGAVATGERLIEALAQQRPAVVVTTSHGMTGPLDDQEALIANLGLLVDEKFRVLDLEALLAAWQPDGAIWYAHACCSAGSDGRTAFSGVVPEGSEVAAILSGVAAVGNRIAPLPTALLSAAKPARAFIGHVEPTFDWTISDPRTGQPLTGGIRDALYERLYQPWPVGHALRTFFDGVGDLFGARDLAYEQFNQGDETLGAALLHQLAALDRRSLVVLGDPTVRLPAL
jgi:hypothetical protein